MATTNGTTAAPIEWKVNPHHGNINPGTKQGQAIFEMKTRGLPEDKRLDLTKANAPAFRQYIKAREGDFGNVVTKIAIAFDAGGNPLKHANLITQHSMIQLTDVKREAHKRFATALAPGDEIPAPPHTAWDIDPANDNNDKKTFYSRVNSLVVATSIKNCLSVTGWDDLMQRKDSFSFLDSSTGELHYDGPVMLKIILEKIDPDTLVGMETLRTKLETAKLLDFGNDVDKALTYMEGLRKTLRENGHDPESFRQYVSNTLLSGPNAIFNAYIQRIVDDYQAGIGQYKDISAEDICQAARTKYNNMVEDKSWSKVDPRDAQLLALATQVAELKALKTLNKPNPSAHSTNGGGGPGVEMVDGTMPKWRTIKDGDSKVVDGRTWHWCSHHKHKNNLWDGLYVSHPKSEHEKYTSRYKRQQKKALENKDNSANATSADKEKGDASSSTPSLDLASRLKEVLCTNLCLSSEDAQKLISQASSSGN